MTDSVIDYGAQSCTVFCCNLQLGKILEMDMHVTDCTMFCSAFQFTIGLGVCGLLTNVLDCKASGQGQGSTPGHESEGMCFSSSDSTCAD